MQESTFLIAAYIVVWVGLFAYLAFLAMRIRGVRTELAAVEELVREYQEKKDEYPYGNE
ncbi:MAG TPA: CcmD family protein [Ktedonobacteraceae bacterium]|nr:CcmD family protein [Ktedonobacteraceae bacterium]